MDARWPIALAMLAILTTPAHSSAQARGRVSVVGPHPPRTSTQRPLRTMVTVPPFSGARRHVPTLFRSPIFGLFLFDPYWWVEPDVDLGTVAPTAMPVPGPILIGGLQLDVEPRRALVYVDGVLAGTVDQFKGYFQHLETTAGYHVISFLTADYDPLTIDVTVVPNRTTTYRGALNRSSGR
jgi:hypothetical protein